MTECKPIFDTPNAPVRSASWFKDAINEYLSYASDQSSVFLLANLMLDFQHKATVMYCPDTYLIPLPPTHFTSEVVRDQPSCDMALESIRHTVTYFVECDGIPDNDRGYWHTRLENLIKEVQRAHPNHVSLMKACLQL